MDEKLNLEDGGTPCVMGERKLSCFYTVLFFVMGLCWFAAPLAKWVQHACNLSLILFYFVHRVFFRGDRIGKRLYLWILFLCVYLVHLSLVGLLELGRMGEIPTLYMPFSYNSDGYMVACMNQVYHPVKLAKFLGKFLYFVVYGYCLVQCLREDEAKGSCLRAFAWGTLCFILLMFFLRPQSFAFYGFRLSLELVEGSPQHPNSVGVAALIALFVHLLSCCYERYVFVKMAHWLFCVLAIFIMVLSGARSSLLALLVASAYLISGHRRVLLILGVLCVALAVTWNGGGVVLPKRMTVEGMCEDRGSGRLNIWKDYYTYADGRHYLLGVGPLATTSVIFYNRPYLPGEHIAHPSSIYIYILLTYGVGGFAVFLAGLLAVAQRLWNRAQRERAQRGYFAMFLAFCVWGLTSYMELTVFPLLMGWALLLSRSLSENEIKGQREFAVSVIPSVFRQEASF